jgi:hypothetical protein
MSNHIKGGGPAFPVNELNQSPGDIFDQHLGMTLRDYFAAKALPAVMAANPVTGQVPMVSDFRACAECAYAMADAMLAVRAAQAGKGGVE